MSDGVEGIPIGLYGRRVVCKHRVPIVGQGTIPRPSPSVRLVIPVVRPRAGSPDFGLRRPLDALPGIKVYASCRRFCGKHRHLHLIDSSLRPCYTINRGLDVSYSVLRCCRGPIGGGVVALCFFIKHVPLRVQRLMQVIAAQPACGTPRQSPDGRGSAGYRAAQPACGTPRQRRARLSTTSSSARHNLRAVRRGKAPRIPSRVVNVHATQLAWTHHRSITKKTGLARLFGYIRNFVRKPTVFSISLL